VILLSQTFACTCTWELSTDLPTLLQVQCRKAARRVVCLVAHQLPATRRGALCYFNMQPPRLALTCWCTAGRLGSQSRV
jgi:hypothetical protein